jgi:AraC-like DNA-binding protein
MAGTRVRPLPSWSAVLAPVVAHTFEELRISVSLNTKHQGMHDQWHPFHIATDVTSFEYEHGVAARRWAYNAECFDRVRKTGRLVRGEHAGFHDLFVPVATDKDVRGILVAGPFATSRPTSTDVTQRWEQLTGSRGRLSDPSFSEYLSTTLSTLTLEGPMLDTFQGFLSCFARLVGGQGAPDVTAAELTTLRSRIVEVRLAEKMWEAAHALADERTTATWPVHAHELLTAFDMKRPPQHVVVGLLLGRQNEPDRLDEILRQDAFQRAAAGLARRLGDAMAGRVGDYGVYFLCDHLASDARSKLTALATRASTLARRYGFKFHAGISRAEGDALLPSRYRQALWAAEKALSQGVGVVYGEPHPERSAKRLRKLRARLADAIGDRINQLSPRFDQYIEAVLVHCGYRLEPIRAQLEGGLERLAEPLLASGALDEKSFDDLCASMERTAEEARTVMALVAPYRRLLSDIESTLQSPTRARHDRGTRRAIAFMSEHLSEPFGLAEVARVAGFAPSYFSRMFKREEGITLEVFVRKMRIERAREMLAGANLSVERVRQLCGFRTRSYFYRVFKESIGTTPNAYRRQIGNRFHDRWSSATRSSRRS